MGTGQARSFADLTKAVFSALMRPESLEFIDMPDILKGRYQYFTQSVNAGLGRAGYAREFASLEAGVKDYVQRFLTQDDPYR